MVKGRRISLNQILLLIFIVRKKGVNTVRDIGPGSTRMELVFAYGSPNAMWRDQKNETYIFLYEGHSENSWPQKKGFLRVL